MAVWFGFSLISLHDPRFCLRNFANQFRPSHHHNSYFLAGLVIPTSRFPLLPDALKLTATCEVLQDAAGHPSDFPLEGVGDSRDQSLCSPYHRKWASFSVVLFLISYSQESERYRSATVVPEYRYNSRLPVVEYGPSLYASRT
jgi:hypothetical protein